MVDITYNSYAIPNIYGAFQYSETEVAIQVSCNFLVTAASASALVTACQAAEVALTEKNKALTVKFSSNTELSFSHTGNTGFNSRATLTLTPNELNTETSRAYHFAVTIQLPFDQSGYDARREGSFTIAYLPTRQKVVNFTMLYTATAAATAIANYNSTGKTWAASILTSIGGTYELTQERTQEEQERKIITATLTYKEILTAQSSLATDDTYIVDPQVSYSCNIEQRVGKGITFEKVALPIVHINISFQLNIDKTVAGTDINAAYYNRVRPHLIGQAFTVLGLSFYTAASYNNYVVEAENKTIDPYSYQVSGTLAIAAFQQTHIISFTENVTIETNPNITYKKIWDGQDYTYTMYSMGKSAMITRMITIAQLASRPSIPDPLTTQFLSFAKNAKWVKIFPTTEQYRLDLWGQGSKGTDSRLKGVEVHFAVFREQYLCVRSITSGNGGVVQF